MGVGNLPGRLLARRAFTDRRVRTAGLVVISPLALLYLVAAFTDPNPLLRIVLRTVPVLPVAIWTLWLDARRPLQQASPPLRFAGRCGALLLIMGFAVALLGLALNFLYDPARIL